MKIRTHIFITILAFTILVFQLNPAKGFVDVGVTSIIEPTCAVVPGTWQPIIVVITNFGTIPVTTFPVGFFVNNDLPVTATYAGFIAPSSSDTFEFFTLFLVPGGPFTFCSYTMGDLIPANDTTCICNGNPMFINEGFDNSQNHLIISPNPSSGHFTLKLRDHIGFQAAITINDTFGRKILEGDFIKPEFKVDLSGEANGLYLVILKSPYAVSTSKLLIIK